MRHAFFNLTLNRLNRRSFLAFSAALAATGGRRLPAAASPAPLALRFEEVATGFKKPLGFVDPNDNSGRLFVVEQGGAVRVLLPGASTPAKTPLLDISKIISKGPEQGLLGIALHPDFPQNGTLIVSYTDKEKGNSIIERWSMDPDNPNRADPTSRVELLSVYQPYDNHNGGLVLFGPDRMLYAGFGDGGGGGDPDRNAQNLRNLLGTIIRIDVDRPTETLAYGIPPDNPFVGVEGVRPEIWVYGLRNPWRFAFDRATGDCFIADVGQGDVEELDFVPAGSSGQNFGWPDFEGNDCFREQRRKQGTPVACPDPGSFAAPIFTYRHDDGHCSVTGGAVYRGSASPQLQGMYLCADFCSGTFWGIAPDPAGGWMIPSPQETDLQPAAFGEDAAGELYVLDFGKGRLLRILPEG